MKYAFFFFLSAFLLGGQAYTQGSVADWFPIHEGDKWVYEHQTRDSGLVKDDAPVVIHNWKTEETTIGLWTVPEGTILERKVQITDGSPPPGWKVDPIQASLVQGSCLFTGADWDSKAHQLRPDFRKLVDDGRIPPDFCFPLLAHKTWGAPHFLWENRERPVSEAKDWQVVDVNAHDPSAPDKQTTFHIASLSSFLGAGMTADIWYEKGVGVVKEVDGHYGALGEVQIHLLEFHPAAQK